MVVVLYVRLIVPVNYDLRVQHVFSNVEVFLVRLARVGIYLRLMIEVLYHFAIFPDRNTIIIGCIYMLMV